MKEKFQPQGTNIVLTKTAPRPILSCLTGTNYKALDTIFLILDDLLCISCINIVSRDNICKIKYTILTMDPVKITQNVLKCTHYEVKSTKSHRS